MFTLFVVLYVVGDGRRVSMTLVCSPLFCSRRGAPVESCTDLVQVHCIGCNSSLGYVSFTGSGLTRGSSGPAFNGNPSITLSPLAFERPARARRPVIVTPRRRGHEGLGT